MAPQRRTPVRKHFFEKYLKETLIAYSRNLLTDFDALIKWNRSVRKGQLNFVGCMLHQQHLMDSSDSLLSIIPGSSIVFMENKRTQFLFTACIRRKVIFLVINVYLSVWSQDGVRGPHVTIIQIYSNLFIWWRPPRLSSGSTPPPDLFKLLDYVHVSASAWLAFVWKAFLSYLKIRAEVVGLC